MIYGYKRKTIDKRGLLEMKEVTFALDAAALRTIGSFFAAMADEMEAGAFEQCSHRHISSVVPKWSDEHPTVDIIVMPPIDTT